MELKEKTKSIVNRMKKLDIFGHQIDFHYKNSSKYKSVIGGIITVIVLCGLFSYFGLLLIATVKY